MKIIDPKNRFSNRADDYQKYRPGYPMEVISFILENCSVDDNWIVADIGSGTGISAKLLLDGLKCKVFGVEPNKQMRIKAEADLNRYTSFRSINGSAEKTLLNNESVNIVTAFQALHWFRNQPTLKEFYRILKKPGWVLIVWNTREIGSNMFLSGYENLLEKLPEYKKVDHSSIKLEEVKEFVHSDDLLNTSFPNSQMLDFNSLVGRFFSSSYSPSPEEPGYQYCFNQLKKLFKACNIDGVVELKYRTEVYLAKVKDVKFKII